MYLKLSWLYLGMALNSNLKQIVKPGPQTTKAQPHPSPNKFRDPLSPKGTWAVTKTLWASHRGEHHQSYFFTIYQEYFIYSLDLTLLNPGLVFT